MSENLSGLAFIDVQDENPFKLFKEWQNEVKEAGCPFFHTNAMCLATSTKNGKVGNRNVLLKELDDNEFIFATTAEGRKVKEIQENPNVAATFMWNYLKNENEFIRQVRIEGKVHQISSESCQKYYDEEIFFCKMRAHLCHQDQEVDWKNLKEQHDELLKDVTNNKTSLPMPDYYVGYRIVPEKMDFYFAWNHYIGDRVVFTKKENSWSFIHVAA